MENCIFNTADSSPPSISFSPNSEAGEFSLNVTITVTDAGNGAVAGVHQVWTYVSTSSSPPSSSSSSWGNPVRTFTAYQNSTTATVTIPASTGQRYIHVKATDRLGNERISTSAVYRTDVTAPSISANIQNRAWANSNVSVTLTFSDSHSESARDSTHGQPALLLQVPGQPIQVRLPNQIMGLGTCMQER